MANETKRYRPGDVDDAPLELGDVLEPFDPSAEPPQPFLPYEQDFAPDESGTRRYPGGGYPPYAPEAYAGQAVEPDLPGPELEDGYPGGNPYDDGQPFQEEYSDYHQELDEEERARSLFGVFNLISTLAGVAVILVLAAMLFSLVSWLRTDIIHSITLLQSGLQ